MANAITKRTQRTSLPVTAGDIIFVRPAANDRVGQLIAEATGGLYSHCQVVISSTQVVEAVERGVVESWIQVPPPAADVASIGRSLEGPRLAHARGWALDQVDQTQYSALDIVADVLLTFLPRRLGARTPFLVAPSTLDCSELACRFLVWAGYMWLPPELAMQPQTSSPNALARALGVLK